MSIVNDSNYHPSAKVASTLLMMQCAREQPRGRGGEHPPLEATNWVLRQIRKEANKKQVL